MCQFEIDKEKCIGTGLCVAQEPTLFRFDARSLAEPVGDASGLSDEEVEDIIEGCPVEAIRLIKYDSEGSLDARS